MAGAGLRWFDRVPLLVAAAAVASVLMAIPGLHAAITGDGSTAVAFLVAAPVCFSLVVIVALTITTLPQANAARALLLSLVGIYLLMPAMLALPLMASVEGMDFHDAWFEMISSITTTGMTVTRWVDAVPDAVHLWRAIVGWYGGLVIWIAAVAILAPLRLGGFEVVLTSSELGREGTPGWASLLNFPMRRIWRFAKALLPIYCGLTAVLWMALLMAGEAPFIAACHAMSTVSSSGISPVATLADTASGRTGEIILFIGMAFALNRAVFGRDMPRPLNRRLHQDPELRLAARILIAIPLVILLDHWLAALELGQRPGWPDALAGWWGGQFLTLSFMTTTGFIPADWDAARVWSGQSIPGLLLLGVAMVGGGIATTAGGVKLLRVYVLYKHGQFEFSRLVHPRLVASPGSPVRRFRLEAAYVAWLYFGTFALALTGVMLALSLFGLEFEECMILAISALSTAGQLVVVGGDAPIDTATLGQGPQSILAIAMVLGRLETLAIVALFNPDFWRA